MKCLLFAALLANSLVPVASHDEDTPGWPQWRGPDLTGNTTESSWASEGGEQPLWQTSVGLGYSSVTVAGDRLYTMGFDPDAGLDVVWCLDAKTGEEIWSHTYPSKIWDQYHKGGTLTTPTIDGDVVYTLNREGSFFCLDATTGEVRYQRHFKQEMDVEYPTWGFSASPLALGDELYVNVGKVVSLDKETGKNKWVSKDYGAAYSTPAPFEHEGKQLLAVFNGNLAIIEREGGTEVATMEWKTNYDVNAATPIIVDDAIFISSGYGHGGAFVAFDGEHLEPIWETKEMRSHMSGPVLIDDHLYGFDEEVLKCIDLDGTEMWAERGLGKGALMGSPDRLIVMSGEGELIILAASPEGYQELSRSQVIDDGGPFWTKPVLVDGIVYCRSQPGALVARDHRAER